MSEQPTTGNDRREIPGLAADLDPAEQDVRIGSDEGDDLPVTPPDIRPRTSERAMAGEPDDGETIEQRIMQEVPDPNSAYGAPDNESGLDGPEDIGGDDPDAIPADEDFLGFSESADNRAVDGPVEEAAMHLEGDDLD
ncbi:MAG: adenosine deaminase [Dermatophilaceae bacterium]